MTAQLNTDQKQLQMQILALRLRAAREASGLTLADLAKRIGYAESTLSRVERGLAQPTDRLLDSIRSALHIHPEWLERGIEPMFMEPPRNRPDEMRGVWEASIVLERAYRRLVEAISNAESAWRDATRNVNLELTKHSSECSPLDEPMPIPSDEQLLAQFRADLANAINGRRGAQSEVARILGVSRQAVAAWVSGESNPEAGKLLRLLAWVQAARRNQKRDDANVSASASPETQPGTRDANEAQSGPPK